MTKRIQTADVYEVWSQQLPNEADNVDRINDSRQKEKEKRQETKRIQQNPREKMHLQIG